MKNATRLMILLLSVCFYLVSCHKQIDLIIPEEDEYITIPIILMQSDISVSDEPLTTKASSGEMFYAISVSQWNENAGGYYENYAFGFFDSMNGVSIKMNKKLKYSIKAAVFYDYFSNGYSFISTDNDTYVFYSKTNNDFVYYKTGLSFYGLSTWSAEPRFGTTTQLIPSNVYYNSLEGFDPSKSNSCSIELKRVSTGIAVDAEGLSEGRIQIQVASNDNRLHYLNYELTPEKPSVSEIFCLSRLMSQESGSMYIEVNYYYPSGEKELLYNEVVSFTRNMRKRLHIVLENSVSSQETNAAFSISMKNDAMGDEEIKTISGII